MLKKITTFLNNPDNGDKLVAYACALAALSMLFIQLPGSETAFLTVNWK